MAGPVRDHGVIHQTIEDILNAINGEAGAGIAGAALAGQNIVANSVSVGPYGAFLQGAPALPTPPGITNGKVWDYGGAMSHIGQWGAVADHVVFTDGAITGGLAVLTSPGNHLAGAVAGMAVGIVGAGTAGATFVTTILSVQGNGQATLSANAVTGVSGATAGFGTDNTAAINDALSDYADWSWLQFGGGAYAVTGSIVPVANAAQKRIWGTGWGNWGGGTPAVLGTFVGQLTDNIPIWLWTGANTHSIDWKGMTSGYLAYQGAGNTQAYGCMWSNQNGGGGFFYWDTNQLEFRRCYVGMGVDPANPAVTVWGSNLGHAKIIGTQHNGVALNGTGGGKPVVQFVHLYIANTGTPVVSDGDAINCAAQELSVWELDVEGWYNRILVAGGTSQISLRDVHVEQCIFNNGFPIFDMENAGTMLIDQISIAGTNTAAGTKLFRVTGGAGMILRGIRIGITISSGDVTLAGSDGSACGIILIEGFTDTGGNVRYPCPQAEVNPVQFMDPVRKTQTPVFNATPTPDPRLGENYAMAALIANVTAVANPPWIWKGSRIRFYWLQDGTGTRTVAYSGSAWRVTGAPAMTTAAGTLTIDDFESIDGTSLRLTSRMTGLAA